MTLWRISSHRRLDGAGGLLAPGRWHTPGIHKDRASCTAPRIRPRPWWRSVSSLVRNVPFLTSIEVSLFFADAVGGFWFFFRSKPTRRRWESGKPALGFPLFHRLVAGAVGMWESRRSCEISKERWEEGKSCFWISTLSTAPPFPQLSCFISWFPRVPAFVDSVFARGGWPAAAPASDVAAAVWPAAVAAPGAP